VEFSSKNREAVEGLNSACAVVFHMLSSTGAQIARGGLWMLLFKIADRALAIIGIAVLARLLTPADFGLVAMTTVLIDGIELATSFGFDIALLRDARVERARYDTAWTLNLLLGVGAGVLLLLFTIPAATFYSEPRLYGLMPLLAIGMAIKGFENVGTVEFRKQMDFRREFVFMATKRFVNFAFAVAFALWLRNYWALALSILTSRAVGVVLSFIMAGYRPRLRLSEAKDLFHFSKWLMFTNLLWFLQGRLPDFIIGRIAGPRDVGLYSNAADIARMPTTEIVAPINRAVYPGYARHRDDVAGLSAIYLQVIAALWSLALPAAVGLAIIAQPFVLVFLGDQWLSIVPTMRVLTIAGFCGLIVGNQHYVYLALGRSHIVTRLATIQLVAMIVGALWMAPRLGIIGIAYAVLFSSALDVPISFTIFNRVTKTGWSSVWQSAWRPMLATGAMTAVLLLIHPGGVVASDNADAVKKLVTTVALGALSYVAVLLFGWIAAGKPDGPERQALTFLQNRLRRFRLSPEAD
jgi:O-antigen/teichoic acid export membrane protein